MPRPVTKLSPKVLALVSAHGEREGRLDYEERAEDVASGAEEPSWAWPFAGADDAYVSAIGPEAICEEMGLDARLWEHVREPWLAGFRRGYEQAHAEGSKPCRE